MPQAMRFRNVCFTVNNPGISKEDYLHNMLKNVANFRDEMVSSSSLIQCSTARRCSRFCG